MVPTRIPITPDILESYVSLFRGRADVYGSWTGGCIRKPLNDDRFLYHLQGDELIGVYPLVPYRAEWWCVWGCSDIDVDDLDAARNLEMAFRMKDIKAWVEKTRKGYHVWVFANTLTPAAVMRRAFLAAHQAVNYPAKEVNPKQESAGTGYGNYVRLPYPTAISGELTERYMLRDDDTPMPFTEFLEQAITTKATLERLEAIAALWVPPRKMHVVMEEADIDVRTTLRAAGPLTYVIWRDGPLEGADRSGTLFRLACRLRDAMVEPMPALAVIKSADLRWGKFHERRDGMKEMVKLIERAYNIILEDINE